MTGGPNTDTATVDEDSTSNLIDVLANDTDIDGDALTVTSPSAANGTVSVVDIVGNLHAELHPDRQLQRHRHHQLLHQ